MNLIAAPRKSNTDKTGVTKLESESYSAFRGEGCETQLCPGLPAPVCRRPRTRYQTKCPSCPLGISCDQTKLVIPCTDDRKRNLPPGSSKPCGDAGAAHSIIRPDPRGGRSNEAITAGRRPGSTVLVANDKLPRECCIAIRRSLGDSCQAGVLSCWAYPARRRSMWTRFWSCGHLGLWRGRARSNMACVHNRCCGHFCADIVGSRQGPSSAWPSWRLCNKVVARRIRMHGGRHSFFFRPVEDDFLGLAVSGPAALAKRLSHCRLGPSQSLRPTPLRGTT